MEMNDDLSLERSRPLKQRSFIASPAAAQEVISLQNSSDDELISLQNSSDDDEIATLKASPLTLISDKNVSSSTRKRGTFCCSMLSQLTGTSPTMYLATQPTIHDDPLDVPKKSQLLECANKVPLKNCDDNQKRDYLVGKSVSTATILKLTKAPSEHATHKPARSQPAKLDNSNSSKPKTNNPTHEKKAKAKAQAPQPIYSESDKSYLTDSTKQNTLLVQEKPAKVSMEPEKTSVEPETVVQGLPTALVEKANSKRRNASSDSAVPRKKKKMSKDKSAAVLSHGVEVAPVDDQPVAPGVLPQSAVDQLVVVPQTVITAATAKVRKSRPKPEPTPRAVATLANSVIETVPTKKHSKPKPEPIPRAAAATLANSAIETIPAKKQSKPKLEPIPRAAATLANSAIETKPATSDAYNEVPVAATNETTEVVPTKSSIEKRAAPELAATANAHSAERKTTNEPKKAKKMTFQEQVLHHMLWAFKPFTLKTLSEELKTTEAALNYVMLSLVDKGLIWKKDYTSSKGKVKTLYWGNHDAKSKEVKVQPPATTEERDAAKQEMTKLLGMESSMKILLAQEMIGPTNQELAQQLKQEEELFAAAMCQLEEVQARLRKSNAETTLHRPKLGSGPPKSAALLARERCPNRLKMRINHMRGEWKKRKDLCMDFIDNLADGMEKKTKDALKIVDIDTDEMNSAIMPLKHNVT